MLSASGWSVLPPPDSRRQRVLREPVELFTRSAISGFGPRPTGGFAALLAHRAPALSQTAPPIFTAEHFPLAHIRGASPASMR